MSPQTMFAWAILIACLAWSPVIGAVVTQTGSAELAARMNGRWKLNRELSPALTDPGQRGERGRGAASLSVLPARAQRGGRGGGMGGGEGRGEMPMLTAAEAAAQAALSVIQQLPLEMTIEATEAEMTITEPRGKSHFVINNKTSSIEVPGGGNIKIKSKWDRTGLRQEFSSTQRLLRRSWSIDSSDRLVLKQWMESVAFGARELKAVFDRQ